MNRTLTLSVGVIPFELVLPTTEQTLGCMLARNKSYSQWLSPIYEKRISNSPGGLLWAIVAIVRSINMTRVRRAPN